MATTQHPYAPPRATEQGDVGLAAPSRLPRRLVLTGLLLGFAGVASLLAAAVPGVLVGFDAPAASSGLTPPPLPLGVALTVAGAVLVHAGRLLVRADARARR